MVYLSSPRHLPWWSDTLTRIILVLPVQGLLVQPHLVSRILLGRKGCTAAGRRIFCQVLCRMLPSTPGASESPPDPLFRNTFWFWPLLLPPVRSSLFCSIQGFQQTAYPIFFSSHLMSLWLLHIHLLFDFTIEICWCEINLPWDQSICCNECSCHADRFKMCYSCLCLIKVNVTYHGESSFILVPCSVTCGFDCVCKLAPDNMPVSRPWDKFPSLSFL